MPKYKFSDIAFNITEKRMPVPEDMETYIAPNNLETSTLSVPEFGYKVPLNGLKLVMHKGDVLFGRREPQLKHAAIAPHDGIFSAHGMIFHANPDVIDPDFFPFFIASDCFFDTAIRISVGSLSPTVNWKDLKNIEFTIPDMDVQKRYAKVLWAIIRAKRAYRDLINQTDELVKSQFIEQFGDPIKNSKRLPTRTLSEIATSRLGKMLDAKKQTGENKRQYLANMNVQWFHFDLSQLNQMDFDEADRIEFELRDGDLMVCEGGEVGRCAVWHNEIGDCYFQKAIHRVRCNTDVILPEYLMWWFKIHSDFNSFEDIVGSKATIAHLPGVKLKALEIPLPDICEQKRFVSILGQSDKSKFELKKALESLDAMQKAIVDGLFQCHL